MIRNYLLVTFRNLLKNKVFTIINILGLGIALSVCIVAFFNQMFYFEFDRTHENFNKIYRINSLRDMQGSEQENGNVPATLGLVIKKDIPGIERSVRLRRGGLPVKVGDNLFSPYISYVDPEFLDMFTIPIIAGDKNSIEDHGNVFVSRKMASILFGNEFPVGKTITIIQSGNKEFSYSVGAVFEDLPLNSSFRIDILTHFDNYLLMFNSNDADWKMMTTAQFIQVSNKSSIPSIVQLLKNYIPVQNKAREDFKINRFKLVPLKEAGANSRIISSSGLYPNLHPAAVVAPPIMAIFILLIACFNFANTSIATFGKRLKEIGLRKTFGGLRKQLVSQFMFETIIICFLALLAGIAFAAYLVPAYSNMWGYMSLELTFTRYLFFWVFLILLLLVTGFISGVYPAIFVSSFSPVNVLKGASPFRGSGKLSLVLLTMQFAISIMSLVMGVVFVKNAKYQETLDRGYDLHKLIVVQLPAEYYTSFRNAILTNPKIISAEGTQNHIGFGANRRTIRDQDKRLEVDALDIGPEYSKIMGLRLISGRIFDESHSEADRKNRLIIVNQTLVDAFGWKDPVGRYVTMNDTIRYTVIGVVKDFYAGSVWAKIEPAILKLSSSDRYGLLVVRSEVENVPKVLDYLNKEWKSMLPNIKFGGLLQEDTLEEEKNINGSIMKVNIFLAIVAALLSLIGMYNLVSLDIIRRTKEMGIRKIQGASVPLIMFLVSRKFLVVLTVASLFGCAGGYYMSVMLLDSIWDYFTKITFEMLLFSVIIMVTATTSTIIFKITKAARKNPVDSLRYE
jgi:putative ABC transport system permease protein